MLFEQRSFEMQLDLNHTRHIMSAVVNTVVDKKKRPRGFAPKDIMHLPMLDDKSRKDLEQGQKDAEDALKYFKTKFK